MLKAGTPDRSSGEPVGTGPFSLDSYRRDVAIRYRAFEGYWGGRPKLDALVYSITPDASIRLAKLKAGECQAMFFPNPADAGAIEADPRLALLKAGRVERGLPGHEHGPPPVRRPAGAAGGQPGGRQGHAGPRRLRPRGRARQEPGAPTSWAYDDAVRPYPYDPAAARRLMSEAGLDKGVDVDLWSMPVARAYNPDGRRVAEVVADDLARVGVRPRLVNAPWAAYRDKLLAGEPPMAFFGWTSDNGDPDNFLDLLLGCRDGRAYANNVVKWCDPRYDALVAAAKLTVDRDRRAGLYRQAQAVFHDAAPWVPIAHGVVLSAARRSVRASGSTRSAASCSTAWTSRGSSRRPDLLQAPETGGENPTRRYQIGFIGIACMSIVEPGVDRDGNAGGFDRCREDDQDDSRAPGGAAKELRVRQHSFRK